MIVKDHATDSAALHREGHDDIRARLRGRAANSLYVRRMAELSVLAGAGWREVILIDDASQPQTVEPLILAGGGERSDFAGVADPAARLRVAKRVVIAEPPGSAGGYEAVAPVDHADCRASAATVDEEAVLGEKRVDLTRPVELEVKDAFR